MTKPELTSFNKLGPLFLQQFERYLPTAFDNELTIVEKVNKVIQYMSQTGLLVDSVVDQWNELMQWLTDEGLKDTVTEILEEWKLDGSLAEIVNQVSELLTNLFINVMEFGATGDETQDATPFIQQAIDATTTRKAKVIYFPAGTYSLNDTLWGKPNITLLSYNGVVFKKKHNKNAIFANFDSDSSPLTGYNAYGGITIDGGLWDNGGMLTDGGQCFFFAHAKDIVVKNTYVKNVRGGHGIEVNSCDGVTIENNKFYGFMGENFRGAVQLDIDKDGAFGGDWGKYQSNDFTQCKNIKFRNNEVGGTDLGNWGRAIESHSCITDRPYEYITIQNNIIYNTQTNAIRAYNWNHVIIDGNQMYNCGTGIMINTPFQWRGEDTRNSLNVITNTSVDNYDFKITNNHIDGSTLNTSDDTVIHALSLWGQPTGYLRDYIISGNTVINSSTTGIFLYHAKNGSVNGNMVRDCAANGISGSDTSNTSYNGNTVQNAGATGMYIYRDDTVTTDSVNLSVSSNVVTDCAAHGIYLFTVKGVNINGNMITNCVSNSLYVSSNASRVMVSNNNIFATSGAYGVRITNTTTQSMVNNNLVNGVFSGSPVLDEKVA